MALRVFPYVGKFQFIEPLMPPLCKGRWPSASEVGGVVRNGIVTKNVRDCYICRTTPQSKITDF